MSRLVLLHVYDGVKDKAKVRQSPADQSKEVPLVNVQVGPLEQLLTPLSRLRQGARFSLVIAVNLEW